MTQSVVDLVRFIISVLISSAEANDLAALLILSGIGLTVAPGRYPQRGVVLEVRARQSRYGGRIVFREHRRR